jgi:ferric-dicitrate binding protein FerR (iron transport regulator)
VGTTFNVLAYPDDDVIETTLVNGMVILEKVELNEKSKTIGTMSPGQHVEYNAQSGAISSTTGKVEKYISWTDGKLILDDTPILQVAERLSRMFNVDFEIKDELKGFNYTVTLENESLSQILDLMTIATPVLYKMLPRKKLPDGSLSKQKIILEKRK